MIRIGKLSIKVLISIINFCTSTNFFAALLKKKKNRRVESIVRYLL